MEMQRTLGGLTSQITMLADRVEKLGDKVEKIEHQASFIKGGIAMATVLIGIAVGLATWALNAKWDAVLQAIHAVAK